MNDHDRIVVLEQQYAAGREALALQAVEVSRRLGELNHAHERAAEVAHSYVTLDKYEAVSAAEKVALDLALHRADENNSTVADRVGDLERWKAKATGVAAVLVLFAGLVGAAVATALGG